MGATFQISDYYQLRILFHAVIRAKFSTDSPDYVLAGSPLIADIANQIVEVLAQMEIDRGNAKNAEGWQANIVPNSQMWHVALTQIDTESSAWQAWSLEEKKNYARLILSPFKVDEDTLKLFVEQANNIEKDPK